MKTTCVTKESLFKLLDLLANLEITYWLDGGWGVDALYGRQTREHRDADIDYDSAHTERLLEELTRIGYVMEKEELPVRAELWHPEFGYVDIHPFDLSDPTHFKQANPQGGWWVFEREWFGEAVFEGRKIPCISLAGQKIFHSGYELLDKDIHDLKILQAVEQVRYPLQG